MLAPRICKAKSVDNHSHVCSGSAVDNQISISSVSNATRAGGDRRNVAAIIGQCLHSSQRRRCVAWLLIVELGQASQWIDVVKIH